MHALSSHLSATFTRTSSNFWTSSSFADLSLFPSLICDFCPSDQEFAYSFLQIPPHDGHPCCSAIYFLVAYACSGLSPIRARPWRANKKQQWLFQSLLLKTSVSYRNRTYNRVLGGPRYIHLTKETTAVFPGFFDPLAPATFIYNSITSVMNYLFLISSDFSDFASLSDPQTLPFFFKRVPSWFYLRRRLFYPLN